MRAAKGFSTLIRINLALSCIHSYVWLIHVPDSPNIDHWIYSFNQASVQAPRFCIRSGPYWIGKCVAICHRNICCRAHIVWWQKNQRLNVNLQLCTAHWQPKYPEIHKCGNLDDAPWNISPRLKIDKSAADIKTVKSPNNSNMLTLRIQRYNFPVLD